jgi:hypothetical protein
MGEFVRRGGLSLGKHRQHESRMALGCVVFLDRVHVRRSSSFGEKDSFANERKNPGISSGSPPSSSGAPSRPGTLLRCAQTPPDFEHCLLFLFTPSLFISCSWLSLLPGYGKLPVIRASGSPTGWRCVPCWVSFAEFSLAGWVIRWAPTPGDGSSPVRNPSSHTRTHLRHPCSFCLLVPCAFKTR